MGALTVNRKRGFDHCSPNCAQPSIHYPLSHNTHISKRPKFSLFADEASVPSQKGKSRVYLYPEPVNKIKREVHAPCRVTRFGFFGKRNIPNIVERDNCDFEMGNFSGFRYDLAKRVAIGSSNSFRVSEKENSGDEMGGVLGSRYNVAKRAAIGSLRFEDVIDVDDVAEKDLEVVEVLEDEVAKDEHKMEVESDYKDAYLKVENDMKIVNEDDKTTDLVSLNKKLSLLGIPLHKQLWEEAESRNSKLSALSFQIELNERRRAQFQLLRPVKQPIEEVIPPEVFMPLTEEEKAEVLRALSNSNRGRVLASHESSNIAITGHILQCLRPKEWLNDEVINLYLELLKERERREPKKFLKCHFFNSFFYKKLISGPNAYDYKSVRRWTTQRKLGYALFDCEKIFVPIHQQVHWCLAVINKKEKKFQYLDSLGGIDSYVLEALARYYVDEVKDKSGQVIDVSSWKQEYVKDLPVQKNGSDCGVFMLKYTDFYSRGLGLLFNQEHMPYFRQRIVKEILRLRAE